MVGMKIIPSSSVRTQKKVLMLAKNGNTAMFAKCIYVWNHFRKGTTCKNLRYDTEKPLPKAK